MPIKIFGEGAGMIGGNHEDTWITNSAPNSGWGSHVKLTIRNNQRSSLIKFEPVGIPANAIINSAIIYLKVEQQGTAAKIGIYPLKTVYIAGVTQNPPAGANDAPTHSRSRYVSGVFWASGGVFSGFDLGSLIINHATTAVGTIMSFNVTANFQNVILGTADNIDVGRASYALLLEAAGGINQNNFHSLDAVAPANRPYLTVNYTVPSPSGDRLGTSRGRTR